MCILPQVKKQTKQLGWQNTKVTNSIISILSNQACMLTNPRARDTGHKPPPNCMAWVELQTGKMWSEDIKCHGPRNPDSPDCYREPQGSLAGHLRVAVEGDFIGSYLLENANTEKLDLKDKKVLWVFKQNDRVTTRGEIQVVIRALTANALCQKIRVEFICFSLCQRFYIQPKWPSSMKAAAELLQHASSWRQCSHTTSVKYLPARGLPQKTK